MKFVIRDDDLNYFSKSADITRWYEDIFAKNIPVGFATIPFVKKTSDVYPNLPLTPWDSRSEVEKKEEFPVSRNAELLAYIKSNPLIEVVQHGCTHETKNGIYEYQKNSGLFEETKRGKEELEKAFGAQFKHVFAPPHDWISTDGVLVMEATNMDVIRGRGAGLRNWVWRWDYAVIFFRMFFYRFPRYISTMPPVYPHVLNYGKHKEACSYRLEDKDIFEGLESVHKHNGLFVVVVHVHSLTQEKKERLAKLIALADKLKAEFVSPSQLFA